MYRCRCRYRYVINVYIYIHGYIIRIHRQLACLSSGPHPLVHLGQAPSSQSLLTCHQSMPGCVSAGGGVSIAITMGKMIVDTDY